MTKTKYECNNCHKMFNHLNDFRRHKNRKNVCLKFEKSQHNKCEYCNKILSSKNNLARHHITCNLNTISDFQCKFCDKFYSKKSNLTRHLKTCRNNVFHDEDNKQITPHQPPQQPQSVQNINNSNIHNHTGDVYNNTTNNNNTNVQIQNIVVVNKFGQENYDYITKEHYQKLLETPYTSIPRFIAHLHYHPKHPENHNIRMTMTNKKYGLVNVFNGKSWVTADKRKALNRLMDKGYYRLDDEFDKHRAAMKQTYAKRFKNYNYAFEQANDNDSMKKKISKDIEIAMLNNTDVLKLTKRI